MKVLSKLTKEEINNINKSCEGFYSKIPTEKDDRHYVSINLKDLGSKKDIERIVRVKEPENVYSLYIGKALKANFLLEHLEDGTYGLCVISQESTIPTPKLRFNKMKDTAVTPIQDKGNAGIDIFLPTDIEPIVIEPHSVGMLPTALRFKIPRGFYLQVADRGSIGSLGLTYTCGIIDNNYLGEVFLSLANITAKRIIISSEYTAVEKTDTEIHIPSKKAIAQLLLKQYMDSSDYIILEETSDDFDKYYSNRNQDKLGSTDKI